MSCNLTIDARKFPHAEAAFRKFRKRVEKTGIIEDMLRHQYFEKPSARRHRKKLNQRRRSQQLQGVVHAR